MRFAEPQWLIVGAVIVTLLFALRVRGERLTKHALEALSGAHLLNAGALPSAARRWLRILVTCLAVAAGFVALARPQKGKEWQTLDRKGTDLLLVLDTSKSMNTDDVTPTRLERTKLSVRDLVARFPEDRIGLLAFAGDAYLESPMTLDHGALLETLDSVDTAIIPRAGTDIGRAIDSAVSALKADSGTKKVMVLLTDGEDLQGQALDAAKRAAEAGVVIDTVGVGTPAGQFIPAKNDHGATIGVVRDESGSPVRSRLDESGLRAIAQAGHGSYQPLGADGGGLDRLYAESLAPLAHLEKGAKVQRVYSEWFALPLSLALFGLAFDALLGFRPSSRSASARRERFSKPVQGAALVAAALLALSPGRADASVHSAEQAYRAGKFEQAAQQYSAEQAKHPNDARIAIDAGAAAYRAGRFEAAEASLSKALSVADPKLQERVLYDLGDARYRVGSSTLKDAPEKTVERWKAAIDAYEGALKLNPNDADAKFNRDFVKRKLAELQKKQQETKPQEKPQPPSQKGDKDRHDQKGNPGGRADKDQKQNQGEQGNPGKGGEPSSADQKHAPDGKSQGGKDGRSSRNSTQNPAPAGSPGADGKPQSPTVEKPTGDPRNAQGQGGKPDDQRGQDAAPGRLSARDARALLGSLRGEERQVRFGNSTQQHDDDTAQKDW